MPKNRIIYNTQGLFVAPYSGEYSNGNDYYLANSKILKRLEKIQSFNYGINSNTVELHGMASKKYIFRGVVGNPQVTFDFSYIPDGITNENRLNFDVNHFSGRYLPMFSGLCTNNLLFNNKDFYLVINKDENDINAENAIISSSFINPTTTGDVIDKNSPNYSLLHFQNCSLNTYAFDVSVGNLPLVTQNYTADNITFYNSGSGVKYTFLDLKSGVNQTNTDTIIIPKNLNYTQSNLSGENILLPGDATVTFYRSPNNGSTNIISLIPENITPVNMSKVGNVFTKIAGTTWGDAEAYSSIGYNNNMYVEVSPNQTTAGTMFGLSTNPTASAGYDTINYAWHVSAAGTFNIYENGLLIASFGTYTISTKFRIEYDRKTVTYFKDGVSVRSVDVPIPNTTYYFDSSFNQVGAAITANYGTLSNIQFYNDTVQGLNFDLNFNRKNYKSVNYKFPIIKKIEFPVNGKLNINLLTKESFQGSFFDTLNRNDDYNIVVDFASNKNDVYPTQFTFSGCKFDAIEYSSNINSNKIANLHFNFDLDPDNASSRGIYASGNLMYSYLNNQKKILIY
jgi:hypothetical protein